MALGLPGGSPVFKAFGEVPVPELVLVVTLAWILTFCCAVVPFAMSVGVASRLEIRTGWYYALCGILTGSLLVWIWKALDDLNHSFEGQPEQEASDYFVVTYIFLVSGVAGAMTYWWKRGRFLGTTGAA